MQKVMINSKRQAEIYNLIECLEYAPYLVLLNLHEGRYSRDKFKKDFNRLKRSGYVETVKIGHKVFAFPSGKSQLFNERKYELFAWFYFKVIKSGGKLIVDENKIITATGQEFIYNIMPEINSVKLYGLERRYLATLDKLQDLNLRFGKSIVEISY